MTMFVIRGENGMIFTSCEDGENYGKEEIYQTLEEARQQCKLMQKSFKDIQLFIKKIKVGHPTLER